MTGLSEKLRGISIRKLSLEPLTALVMLVLLALSPLLIMGQAYWMHVLIYCMIFAVIAISWDLLFGYTGQFSFCIAAFWVIGMYTSVLMEHYWGLSPWLTLVTAGGISAAIGALITLPCLRLAGLSLTLFTIAFNEFVRLLIVNEEWLTRGPLGMSVDSPFPGIPFNKVTYYYLAYALLLAAFLTLYWLTRSKTGFALKAIRENQTVAETLGINTNKYKLIAFVFSSMFPGIMGNFYAHYVLYINPEQMEIAITFLVVIMVIFGGIGTLTGPLIGAVSLYFMLEFLRAWEEYRLVIFGVIFMIFVLFVPKGLMGLISRVYARFRPSKKEERLTDVA